ncbi:MAG: cell wall metabolism sensor histidine kinase WalK [Clostridiales bacterium]|nr:cell wall metabolism sensor histidine kinase WalK [Clostridiales bacterium]
MRKRRLQPKIILLFFIISTVILIISNVFSYIKIEQIYEKSLIAEFNNIKSEFEKAIDNQEQVNFIKYFNNDKDIYILDNNLNLIQYSNNIELNDSLKQEIISKTKEIKTNELVKNNKYEYKAEIKDKEGNIKYYILINQDKSFIELELKEYKLMMYIMILILLSITLICSSIIIQNIMQPIKKLTKNLDEIIEGKTDNIKNITNNKVSNEIYDLADKFKILAQKLNDNLQEISSQKAQTETILLHMSDGVMAFDTFGNLIYKNPSAVRLLDVDEKETEFDKIFKKLGLNINIEKIIYLQDWTTSEHRLHINDGYVNMFFETYKDEEDTIGGVIVLIQDITEQVKLDNMRKEFVANVSHELKTPITSIKSYSEALIENEMDEEGRNRFLNVISIEAERMARLVRDLLQLSKFDINKDQNKKKEFDLGQLVKRTYDKISIEAQKRGQEVECYVTADVPKIYADEDGIEQVVLNVISNAIKYTPDYGQIKIYVGFVYNHAYIKVIDNGIGIPAKDLNRVFERFYRVDKARSRQQGGTGLGLSIAKEIVERNNGSIDITSEVEKGTEVIIRLPVKDLNNEKKNKKNKNK